MAVPLSKLKQTIKSATLAVTNAAEELFVDGLFIQGMDEGIQFSIQVYDDTATELPIMQVTEDSTPEITTKTKSSELPGGSEQQQTYGRSSESEVVYEG